MENIPVDVLETSLAELTERARQCFGTDLLAIVLFGSAAEGRLRPVSNVNLMICLSRIASEPLDTFRTDLRLYHSAIRAKVMFILRDELDEAASNFAVKFNDIKARHRVLFGQHITDNIEIPAESLQQGLRALLLDLSIRLRERYALMSLREEQLIPVIAESASPLRAAAFAWLELRGESQGISPREALERIVEETGRAEFISAVSALPSARQDQCLPAGEAGGVLLHLSELASFLFAQLKGQSETNL